MRARTVFKRWPIVFLLGAALLLSGCFKVNARIEVRPDGSGQWLIGWAMNQDLRRWSSSSEGSQLDTAELLKRFQGEGISLTAQDLKVREWTEGEFVWQEVSLPFRNPEELNTLAMRSELFESFELKRQPGVVRDRFELRAALKSIEKITQPAASQQSNSMFTFDPSLWFEMQVQVTMPGEVVQTNGSFLKDQPNVVVWRPLAKQDATLEMISESSNPTGVVLLILFVGIVAGGGVAVYRVLGKPWPAKRAATRAPDSTSTGEAQDEA